jgi:hypothetical protein
MTERGREGFVVRVDAGWRLFGWSFDFAQDDEKGRERSVVSVDAASRLLAGSSTSLRMTDGEWIEGRMSGVGYSSRTNAALEEHLDERLGAQAVEPVLLADLAFLGDDGVFDLLADVVERRDF